MLRPKEEEGTKGTASGPDRHEYSDATSTSQQWIKCALGPELRNRTWAIWA
jgi:hypothetical protein